MFEASSPELQKMAELKLEINKLSDEAVELELLAAALAAELNSFQRNYMETVGTLFVFDDRLELALARERARITPSDKDLAKLATSAEQRCSENSNLLGHRDREKIVKISSELKKAFRDAVRTVHPDLAANEEDRAYRTKLTQKLIDAYRTGDTPAIQEIMRDFQLAEMPDNAGKQLVILIRQEHDFKCRIADLNSRIEAQRKSDLAQLKDQFEASSDKDSFFSNLREPILDSIRQKSSELADLGLVPESFAGV